MLRVNRTFEFNIDAFRDTVFVGIRNRGINHRNRQEFQSYRKLGLSAGRRDSVSVLVQDSARCEQLGKHPFRNNRRTIGGIGDFKFPYIQRLVIKLRELDRRSIE